MNSAAEPAVAPDVDLRPIGPDDLPAVGRFLNQHLNQRLSATDWARAVVPPWRSVGPNHGFMLLSSGTVVGAYLAIYSERLIDGQAEKFCNLAAFCVLEPYRAHGLRLVRTLLRQPGFHFTDLSPSGNVVRLNERLGFAHLDNTTVLRSNVSIGRRREVRVVSDPNTLAAALTGESRRVFLDHRHTAAARHILITDGDESCYVIVRKDRRKGLPIFASVLYVTNADLFRRSLRPFLRHILWHHRAVCTLLEVRVIGFRPRGRLLRRPRPRMYKSTRLEAPAIDYLYSELTCVAW